MLKIRLQRTGRKHEPTFRLVLTDSKNSTKSGRLLEVLGNYDSRRGEKAEFNADKIKHWISKGAQTSGTVHNLLVSKNIISGNKINVLSMKNPIKKEEEIEETGTGSLENASETMPENPAEVTPSAEETLKTETEAVPEGVAPEVATEPAPEETVPEQPSTEPVQGEVAQ